MNAINKLRLLVVALLSTVALAACSSPAGTPAVTASTSPSATPTPSTTSRCVQASSTVTPPSGYTLHRFLLQNVPAGDTATVAVNPRNAASSGTGKE